MANYQKVTRNNSFSTSSLALKLVVLIILCISFYLLAKLFIPHIANLLSIALPKLWTVLSAWMSPPYLFITVHLIILVIWKLSEQKLPHKDADPQSFTKPKQQLSHEISPHEISLGSDQQLIPPGEDSAPKRKLSRDISPEIPLDRSANHQMKSRRGFSTQEISSPKISREIPNERSQSDESCVTEEESEERSNSTASSRLEMRRMSKPGPKMDRVKLEYQIGSTVLEEKTEEGDVDDSMDATWKAIVEKIPRLAAPSVKGAREKEPSAGEDEMNQRFDDFIKKSRDQIANRAF
ncbi:hypothetical protein LUZ60_012062 [Juncus effusus]|nr:hypothetical protein LUZ60_012062 [Juncus effusus]